MKRFSLLTALAVVVVGVVAVVWWRRAAEPENDGATTRESSAELKPEPGIEFIARTIGRPAEGNPWIADLTIADLDQDGRNDVIACDGNRNQVVWIRQTAPGVYVEQPIGDPVQGPAHVEVVDLDGDGDRDVLVAGMGIILPNNERIGSVLVLENDGAQNFTNRVLLEKTYRVTYVGAADLDGDGDLDLSVGQFGYFEGAMIWMENRGGWDFVPHGLLELSGTIHAPTGDVDGDGDIDIVALVAQDWEEVYVFENNGAGTFAARTVYGSTNKDFGSSGLTLADLDRDGHLDIVFTNGDAFDYATPGARPWHGVQWLENDGRGRFTFHRIGSFSGAYSPVVVDVDGDGDHDVVVSSGFNDWVKPDAFSLLYFENDGAGEFRPRPIARAPTHLVVVKAADMDGDGKVELVTGGFAFYPPFDRTARVTLWSPKP